MSSTYIANIVALLVFILPGIGVNLGQSELTATVSNIAAIGAGIWVFIGRFRAGGINWWGKRNAS